MLAGGLMVVIAAAGLAFAGTWLTFRSASRFNLVANPNPRSSHTAPTPTGGGLGIVLGGTVAVLYAGLDPVWQMPLMLAASLAIAAIGFLDDLRPIPAGWRLLAQFVVFIVAVFLGVGLLPIELRLGIPLWSPLIIVLLVLGLVYWLNLFNFMDGIDGLAASEATFLLLAGTAIVLWFVPGAITSPSFWLLPGLAAATLGFLLLNWPPARIFMGDAGSTYLGFMIAILALWTMRMGWLGLWEWVILVALFVTDATLTIIRRALRGEPVLSAHRLHAYQHLSRRWKSHRLVTLGAIGINVIWLLPLAWAAAAHRDLGWGLAIVAYAPLIALALYAGSGRRETASA